MKWRRSVSVLCSGQASAPLWLNSRRTDQYMTTTSPTHRHRPPSTNSGTSSTQMLSPFHQHRTTSLSIARRTAGCTSPFRILRFLASLKIMSPSLFRSSVPSGERMSAPNWPTIARRPGVPGATTLRARTSASITGIDRSFRSFETVDFPDAIPPVRPTTTEHLLGVRRLVPRDPNTTKHLLVWSGPYGRVQGRIEQGPPTCSILESHNHSFS